MTNNGDFTIGYGRGWDGGLYIDGLAEEFAINTLLPEMIRFRSSTDAAYGIDDSLQPREGVWTVEFIGGFAQADFDGDGELTNFDFLGSSTRCRTDAHNTIPVRWE